ncbi:hypothetical protein [Duncaniella dubosii]
MLAQYSEECDSSAANADDIIEEAAPKPEDFSTRPNRGNRSAP